MALTTGRRSAEEIRVMRRAGRVVAEMHDVIRAALRPGVTTLVLDHLARGVLERRSAKASFLGYHGYPAVICASPNAIVVHGIPDDSPLEEGDIVSIDCGAIVDGYHGDAAFTAGVGTIGPAAERLVEVTRQALDAAIAALAATLPRSRLGDIGHAVQTVAEGAGYEIVRNYVGHGIGTEMHEPPNVPNHGDAGRGKRLHVGDVLAIEPIVVTGRPETEVDRDGWTVRTVDGSLAAHWEHTVALTPNGPEVLTRL